MYGTGLVASAEFAIVNLGFDVAATGDFNGDAKADLLWRNQQTGDTAIWFMDGLYVDHYWWAPHADPSWRVVGSGDVNADGYDDIVWSRSTGENVVWFMKGMTVDGRYISGAAAGWRAVNVGDFDGDGKADVLWHNLSNW